MHNTQHAPRFSSEELSLVLRNINAMIHHLDEACHRSLDPPSAPPIDLTHRIRTGRRGRPKVQPDPTLFSASIQLRTLTCLAPLYGCSSRTLRRRALEYGFASPGPPLRHQTSDTLPSQVIIPVANSLPTLSDNELDHLIAEILHRFPYFGRRMIAGSLAASGHKVPRDRIRLAYLRVHGAPAIFGGRRIHRKRYKVPGANSLWHHDGQHGKTISSLNINNKT